MVKVGERYFELKVTRKNMKNIYLRLRNETLEVTCPKWVSNDDVLRFIKNKEEWILKVVDKKSDSKLVVDDHIYYLGKKYHLNVVQGKSRVSVNGDELTVYSCKTDMEEVLKTFYKEGSKKLLSLVKEKETKYLSIINDYVYRLNPDYKFRILKSAWGINYPKKNLITINEKLIHFDEKYLEAVLWHEILHFIIPNHSKRFHEILSYHMPEYNTLIKEIY